MARIYIRLLGKQLYYILKLPTEIYLSPRRMAENAMIKIIQYPIKLNMLVSLDVVFLDGVGQVL